MIRQIWVVLRKELIDHLCDRRSVMTALISPLLGPVLFGVMFTMLASWSREDKPLVLPVVGAEHAPNLVAFLKRAGAEISVAPADYEQKVQDGDLDVVLIIPPEYGDAFEGGHRAKLQLVVDNSQNQSRVPIRRAHRLLEAYSGSIGSLRLLARGVSPELAAPVDIDEVDLATPAKMAANVLNMIPMFLLIAAFVGGMHLAIDATAGERERGSLEPLLVNPVTRHALVLGKWIATILSTCVTVLVTLVLFKVVIGRVPLEDLGVKAQFGVDQMVAMFALVFPLTLLAAAAQILISTFARTFKEAQSYVQILLMIPLIPSTLLSISPLKPQLWMHAVPFLAQNLLVNAVMRGEAIELPGVLLAILGTVGAAVLCLLASIRLLGSERIVFGR